MIHADMLHFSDKGRNTRMPKTTTRQIRLVSSHRIASHRIASHRIASLRFASLLLSKWQLTNDEKSKGARVGEKRNDDRTPHDHSKLHSAVESCHHYSSHLHETSYSYHRHKEVVTQHSSFVYVSCDISNYVLRCVRPRYSYAGGCAEA